MERSLRDYFSAFRTRPMHFDVPLEEESPYRGLANTAYEVDFLGVVEADVRRAKEDGIDRIRFFVDGTQRSAIVGEVEIPGGFPIPIIASHIVAGAGEPCGDEVRLAIRRELLAILFPHDAVMEIMDTNVPLPDLPILDNEGGFCDKLLQEKLLSTKVCDVPVFFCDTTWTFSRQKRRRLSPAMLAAVGKVRSAAMSAVDGIRRALEVGVIWELRRKYPEDLVLNDGPLARMMFTMYSRLAFKELESVSRGDPEACFNLLSRVVGLVKNVTIVPCEGLNHVSGASVPVFRLKRPISGEEEREEREHIRSPFNGILSCFCLLRPELTGVVPRVASRSGGLVRIDVPLAAIMENYDEGWMDVRFRIDLRKGSREYDRLRRILLGIMAEKIPYPGTSDPHRLLVELAATEITENMLKSTLLPKEVIRARLSELIFG